MQYKIGSFNLYKFSQIGKKDLAGIAALINEERFDIIAVQEVLNKMALESLARHLGLRWDYEWATPNSKYGSAIAREGFGFLWRKDKLKKASTVLDDGTTRMFEPRIMSQYAKGKLKQRIVRDPYYIRLMPVNASSGWYEIRLLNCHIMFSKNRMQTESGMELPSDAYMRINEHFILCHEVYPKVADKRYGDNLPSYTILLGDYNLNLKGCGRTSAVIDSLFLDTNKQIITVQTDKTTISAEQKEYVNNYDHFSFYSEISSHCNNSKAIDAVHRMYSNSQDPFAEYKEKVSDHVPIVMDFNVKENSF